jgi:DNA-binding MarR family transcriptional regulator
MKRANATLSPDAADPRLAWHALIRVSSRVLRELDRRLELEHGISVNEFDVLINLDNIAEAGLRMTDLANAVMLSSGGLTRLVGRLEQRGLVRRDPDPDDGRGFVVSLTRAGRSGLTKARLTHDTVIRELLGAHLADREVKMLAATLERVVERTR